MPYATLKLSIFHYICKKHELSVEKVCEKYKKCTTKQ